MNKLKYCRIILMLCLCNCLLFYKYILQIFPSVMTHQLMTQYHLNGAALGNLTAAFFYGYALTQIFSGVLVDRYGLKLSATVSLVIATIGIFIFSMSNNLYSSFIARSLMGAGGAFATICYLRCSSSWCPPSIRAFSDGTLTIGVMIGAFLAEAPLAMSIETLGLHKSLCLLVAVGLILICLICFLLKDGPYLPSKSVPLIKSFAHIVKNRNNWILAAYSGCAFAPLAVFGGLWGIPFLQAAYHFPKTLSAGLISLCYIGFGIGGPIFGLLASRYQRYILFMLGGIIISMLSFIAIVYFPFQNEIIIAILMLLLGFGTGSFMIGFTIGKTINNIFLAGSIVAFINSGDAILGAFTEPTIGKILDALYQGNEKYAQIFTLHDYQIALSLLVFYLMIATLCLFRLKNIIKSP